MSTRELHRNRLLLAHHKMKIYSGEKGNQNGTKTTPNPDMHVHSHHNTRCEHQMPETKKFCRNRRVQHLGCTQVICMLVDQQYMHQKRLIHTHFVMQLATHCTTWTSPIPSDTHLTRIDARRSGSEHKISIETPRPASYAVMHPTITACSTFICQPSHLWSSLRVQTALL